MIGVRNRDRQLIVECGGRFLEGDMALPWIALRLGRIPLKLDRDIGRVQPRAGNSTLYPVIGPRDWARVPWPRGGNLVCGHSRTRLAHDALNTGAGGSLASVQAHPTR
jgi:hypothetical protein